MMNNFFTITDIYDNLVPTIQSIPAETYYFKKHAEKIEFNIEKYEGKLNRIIKKLPKCNLKKLNKIDKKLNELYKLRIDLLKEYKQCLMAHINRFNNLCIIADKEIPPKKLSNTGESKLTIKISKKTTEPKKKYCVCNDVAYDDMILCENINCKINWYHMKCIGISSYPHEGWKCHFCTKS